MEIHDFIDSGIVLQFVIFLKKMSQIYCPGCVLEWLRRATIGSLLLLWSDDKLVDYVHTEHQDLLQLMIYLLYLCELAFEVASQLLN